MDRVQKMSIEFGCEPANEGFARVSVAAFAARLNPTIEEVSDIKMAVSEAVTNSIIHGYYQMEHGRICVECQIERDMLTVCIKDNRMGYTGYKKSYGTEYTNKTGARRSGLGFAFMQTFMDDVSVESTPGKGTIVKMTKKLTKEKAITDDIGMAVGYN